MTCGLRPTTPPDLIIPFPAPDGSIARNVAFARRTAADCARLSGDLLPYITTANTARDMDRMRAALGERKLSYFGLSYGSYLGAVYAALFPQRGDGSCSTVGSIRDWCGTTNGAHSASGSRCGSRTSRDGLRPATPPTASVRPRPRLPARTTGWRPPWTATRSCCDGLVLNGNVFRLLTFDGLYSDFRFPGLAALWRDLAQATSGAALPAVRRTVIRTALAAPPTAAQVPQDNLRASQYAIVCGDADWPRDLRVYARNVAVDRRIFPRTAGFPANLWPCPFWRGRPIEPPVEVTPRGPRNVPVLQNLRDPATPWITGFALRQALSRRAAMVSVDQGGHGVYQFTDAPCAADIATRFLVTGALPAHDRLCPGQSPPTATRTNRLIIRLPAGTA